MNVLATSTIARMVSMFGIRLRSGTVSSSILWRMQERSAIKSALEKSVPKKTSHSTSNQMKHPDRFTSRNVILALGKKHIISLTLIIRNIVRINPIKDANYFIPSWVNLGFPVIELKTISKKWTIGRRNRVRYTFIKASGLMTSRNSGVKFRYA